VTSDDEGETWSKPRLVVDSHSPNLPRGRCILVGNLWTDPLGRRWLFFDQSMEMFDGRGGVWATLCDDPDGFQAPDGTIFVSYDRNRDTDGEILPARFTEADVLAKELTGPKSKLKMLISRPLAGHAADAPK
jgi:hypothetical protein